MDIAVIPARGGSKRIPKKNIKQFCGKPMIQYSIEAAFQSERYKEVVVTTDDPEIRDIARSLGAKTPFTRPNHLSDDHTPTVPVIAHAIQELRSIGWDIDLVACIYAAAPFIEPHDLIKSWEMSRIKSSIYTFPVCEHSAPIQRALIMNNGRDLSPLFPENELTRTQDLQPTYFDVGQFYVANYTTWLTKSHIHQNGQALVLPKWRAVDIDDLEDWEKAEKLYASTLSKPKKIGEYIV